MEDERAQWIRMLARLAGPVLENLAHGRLKAVMPVESRANDRAAVTHLEALARLLGGMAPWLELGEDPTPEGADRGHFLGFARAALDAGTDPKGPDFLNFTQGYQPLVDAAFLAQALLRAPRELWQKSEPRGRANVVAALKATRVFKPGRNNWVLFASIIEAALRQLGEAHDKERLEAGLREYVSWYLGDGIYGDGPQFHWDYYNSFVIHPMLVDILEVVGADAAWGDFAAQVRTRALRHAVIQERLIGIDGTYPVIGRSLAYRCGAFHGLAQAALQQRLPQGVAPAQVRGALWAAIARTLGAAGSFDADGWLQIGLAGHQPGLGENYISTGSLYLCSMAFLPLGLAPAAPFWSAPAQDWTARKAWSGIDLPADHAI